MSEAERVGVALAELRRQAGLDGTGAGSRAGMSQSKLSKIENGRLRPSPDDVRALCEVYGAEPGVRDELVELVISLREHGRRSRVILSRGAAGYQQRIARLEKHARRLRGFQPAMVLGLLQTETYARIIMAEELPSQDVDDAVAARRKRATVLDDPDKDIVLIMSEGALRWQIGSPTVMAEQIDAIVEATHRPNLRIGIVPWTTAVSVTCTHGFHVYESATGGSAVVFGTETAAGVLDTTEDITVYNHLFARIEQAALFGADARRELVRIGHDYRLLE